MRRKSKPRAWYTSALFALLIARVIYGFAKFFMKSAEKLGGKSDKPVSVKKKRGWGKRK